MDAAKKTWISTLATANVERANIVARVAELSHNSEGSYTMTLEDESGSVRAHFEGDLPGLAVGDIVRTIGNVRPAGAAKLIYADIVKKVSEGEKKLREAELGPAPKNLQSGLQIETMDI